MGKNSVEYEENRREIRRLEKIEKNEKLKLLFYDLEKKKSIGDEFYTSKGFNSISPISVKSYVLSFHSTWSDLIKDFNRFDKLYSYVINEFRTFYNKNGIQNLHKFIKSNDYITYETLESIGVDKIRESVGVIKNVTNYSDEDMKENFENMFNLFRKIPTYQEFNENTKISINTYADKYNFSGIVYGKMVSKYIDDEKLINEYYEQKKINKSNTGKITGVLSHKIITDEQLKEDFINKFNLFLATYGVNPPRRTLDKLLEYDLTVYRRRYKLSWTGVCNKFGFEITKEANRSEKVALVNVSNVLNEEYLPQKTWDWLIGVGGKHMYCDGYFPNHNLVIEFDGSQHRKSIEAFGGYEKLVRTQENDLLKEELLKANNVKLIRIDSRLKWYDLAFIKSLLQKEGVI